MSKGLRPASVEEMNRFCQGTMMEHLGIVFTAVTEGSITATMPVDKRVWQPFKILHGGASVVLAESLGSLGAHLTLEEGHTAVGLEINANHIRSVSSGIVTGTAEPLHLGRSTQVWQIRIKDEQDRLVCISRLTMAVVPTNRVG